MKGTNTGGGSPDQNLTFLKNISLVSLPKSNLTIRVDLFRLNTVSLDNCVSSGT